MNITDNL